MPRNFNYSTAVTMLCKMLSGGERGGGGGGGGGGHDHLHSFDHVQLQVVKTAPDSQILNLLSVKIHHRPG